MQFFTDSMCGEECDSRRNVPKCGLHPVKGIRLKIQGWGGLYIRKDVKSLILFSRFCILGSAQQLLSISLGTRKRF